MVMRECMYLLVCMNVCCYGDVLFYSIIYIILYYTILSHSTSTEKHKTKDIYRNRMNSVKKSNDQKLNRPRPTTTTERYHRKEKSMAVFPLLVLEEHPGGGGEGGHDDDNPGDTDADGGATGCAPIHLIIGRIPIMRIMRTRHVHIVR